ncbi:MAG TPA: hypothetical protein VFD04_19430 [Actinomycetes bacterium]|jgi:hypothetical protein|nr:hypothetical protein [Actinomycetes bacterium]
MVRVALPLFVVSAAVAAAVAGMGSEPAAAPSALRGRPDLVVELTVDPAEIPPAGGDVQVAVVVRNLGSGPATAVVVTLRPPPGSTPAAGPERPPPRWQCDHTVWRCAYGTLAGGGEAETLTVPLHLPVGSAGDIATVSAAATTSGHETSTDDNAARAEVAWVGVASDERSWSLLAPAPA